MNYAFLIYYTISAPRKYVKTSTILIPCPEILHKELTIKNSETNPESIPIEKLDTTGTFYILHLTDIKEVIYIYMAKQDRRNFSHFFLLQYKLNESMISMALKR